MSLLNYCDERLKELDRERYETVEKMRLLASDYSKEATEQYRINAKKLAATFARIDEVNAFKAKVNEDKSWDYTMRRRSESGSDWM